ncbi:2,5-didehydrogluconate reductase [Chromatiales bacterium (ex Bugula neritina AB1)]|nr:2,5-didehydrogluconate reductase [Chromatiales bacterium (ex Bugula neritina AB1)]
METVDVQGASIPAIGFGTWTLKGEQAASLVQHALETGYRHIDTAALYDNEEAVGAGIRSSSVARDDIFLTTKVWHTDLARGELQSAVRASLDRLGVESVDLLLVHWPSKIIPLAETMEALNDVAASGYTRYIGVSNFTVPLLSEAVKLSQRPLICNQIEYHPMLNQDKVLKACSDHGMAAVSYCPLFRGGDLFTDSRVTSLAGKYNKSPAQIVLRWHLQQPNVIAIPRSTKPNRISENLDVFDFSLADEEMRSIDQLRSNGIRMCDFEFAPVWDG